MRYLKLYRKYVVTQVIRNLEYKSDLFVGLLSVLAEQISVFVFLGVIFYNVPLVSGWQRDEILLIFGFCTAARSIDLFFFDNLWKVGWLYIRTGKLDQILTKPANPLFMLLNDSINFLGVFNYFLGITVIIYSFNSLNLEINIINLVLIHYFILFGGLIFSGINLFTTTFSFWITDSLAIMRTVFSFSDTTKYPLEIYPKIIRNFLIFIFPYAFTGFFPTLYFLTGDPTGLYTILVTLAIWIVSYNFWKFGLKSYIGAGN